MCLIVDANVGNLVFTPTPLPDFVPLWDAISSGRAIAIHGGHLSVEYTRLSATARRLLQELGRQGKVRKADDAAVVKATCDYEQQAIRSDDPHILALAQVTGVRLLCSHDEDLHADFTNPTQLHPCGSVYQTADHAHLIARHCARSRRRAKKRRS